MDTKILKEIGLTEGETKVYLSLLKLGATTTGPLASSAAVSSSKVYKILDRLMKKGLAGHVTRGKVKYYSAMEPNRILEYIDEKKQQLEEKKHMVEQLLPQLAREQESAKEKPQAIVYEGFKAVTNFFRNIVDELKRGETYFVIGAYYGSVAGKEVDVPGLRAFFQQHHTRRAKKGVMVKMLANHDLKGKMVPTTLLKSEVRYLPQYFLTNMEIVFYHDKIFIVLFTKSPAGFLIQNKDAVKNFRTYFDTFWKIAKK